MDRTSPPSDPSGKTSPARLFTKGGRTAAVLALALPAMTTNLLQSAFNLVDIFWVGSLGPVSLAAVSVSAFLIWALFALTQTLSVGVQALVARRVGAGRMDAADGAAWQGLVWGLILGAAAGGIGLPLLSGVFGLMGTAEEVTRQGLGYAGLLYATAPVPFAFFVVDAVFRGRGDAVTPLRILALCLGLNMVLDPLLILGVGPFPALGVFGAALATVISRSTGVVLGLWLLRATLVRGLRKRAVPRIREAWRMVRNGLPVAATGFVFCIIYVVLARITARFGTEPLAALGVGHKVESLSYLTCVGFGTAAATLVGQNLGAGQVERAAALVRRAVALLTSFEVVYTAALLLLAPFVMALFTDDPEVMAHGVRYLRIVALSQVFMGLEIVYAASFGGAGSTLPSLLLTLPVTACRIPLAWTLAVVLGWGPEGIWWAISLTTIVSGAALALWWARGRWIDYDPDPDPDEGGPGGS